MKLCAFNFQMLVLLLCTVGLVLAEPSVGDSYLEAAQSVHDFASDQQYIPDLSVPSAESYTVDNVNNQYGGPNTRTISEAYESPDFHLSSEYGTPNLRNSGSYRNSASLETLKSRLDQSFSSANAKNGISQRYGSPISRNPSSSYGVPSQRSSPLEQYGVPEARSEQYGRTSYNRNLSKGIPAPIQKYGLPKFQSDSFKPNLHRSSKTYTQRNPFANQESSPRSSNQYGGQARNTALSGEIVDKYGANTRTKSQGYIEQDIARSSLSNNALASYHSPLRSPSLEYLPSSRNAMPSQQYGLPREISSDQGYEYARAALDLLNQEPANYEFSYKVSDYDNGSDFGHVETRQSDKATGSYFVLLPDGSKQVVEYEADEDGFRPRISVEPPNAATAFSADGPY
ncbi:pro-resilin-like [Battus philenor]|uniref:pro-resilin-like n=1 Tax=Battus philenor TaxID=42288 RepID=UPI0035CEEEDA